MPIPDSWRAFCAEHNVLAHRNQSRAFLNGEGLGAVQLLPNSKHHDGQKRAIEDWTNIDLPDFRNWSVPLQRTQAFSWTDVDIDLRPPKGVAWDASLVADANHILDSFLATLERFGVTARTFGRESLGFRGHAVVKMALDHKEAYETIKTLGMLRPIPVGDLLMRIEVRQQAEKGDPAKKGWTLPGSTYPGLQGEDLELIGWAPLLPDFRPEEIMPSLAMTTVGQLRKALYGFLMISVVRPFWIEGGRHHLALEVAGALAHETIAGLLDEDEAETVFHAVIEAMGERGKDRDDRLKAFMDTMLTATAGKPVSGYRILGETIGEEARLALLRLRGGSDPDAINELQRRIINVRAGLSGKPCYLDISRGPALYCELTPEQLVQIYGTHPAFPPFQGLKGVKIPMIRAVLASEKIQRIDQAIEIPGIPFDKRFFMADGVWVEINDATPPDGVQTAVNVAAGIPETTEPTEAAAARWLKYWDLALDAITSSEEDIKLLEQAIAWKLQHPRRKLHLGIALTGDQGIGKSALFEVVIKALIGAPLIGTTNGADLKERFRFQTLSANLFYVVEEVGFAKLDKATRELCKNLNKNSTMQVDHKYARKSEDPNPALPIYLTNDENPSILIDGKSERSLVVIRGATQVNKHMDLAQWTDYLERIAAQVADFAEALSDPSLRNAGRHFFLSMPLIEATEFMTNALEASSDIRRASLSTAQEAILEMIESGTIRPGIAATPITGPFDYSTVVIGIRERLKNRGASAFTATNQEVGNLFKKLYPGIVTDYRPFISSIKKQARVYYLAHKLGTVYAMIEKYQGVILTPPYNFTEDDYGDAPQPSKESGEAAWKMSQDPTATFGF